MTTAPDAISTTLQMLTALAVVVGALLVAFYLMKRFLKRDANGGAHLIRVIASQYIGLKKNIALVQVPGTVLVLGISNDRINLLTKIEDQSVLDGIKEHVPGPAASFSDHLQRLTSRIKQVKNGD